MIKHVMCAALLAAGAGAAGLAQSPQERAEARLAEFAPTGETRTCIATHRIRHITPIDDRRWMVELRGGETWLNEVSRGCFGASSPFSYLQYRVPGGQLCRGEIIQVKDQSTRMTRGACGLGDYQQLERAQTDAADTGA
ncbi:hypothetical protein F1654_01695 [Alkalicaulis satelles]|uniref:Uncharacterized protein n=1 Tax=Alkalicaulis satelles TaxID=2609175 RepID=A0A5M6ZIV4_9PROT|nr:hypothetical protein [Alkalicaulis satelles]KAA5804742.1 hypothetical protein F1654_01695 [Alkalicaulis satelles]